MRINFNDIYTTCIYNYLSLHDGDLILYKDIMDEYKMSYPTVRSRINWLIKHKYITKKGRRISIIPQFF